MIFKMEWVLDKDKLMMELKMLVIKYNFKNKYKEIKINKKIIIKMDKMNNKMIYRCKVIFKEKCLIRNRIKIKKVNHNNNNRNKDNNRWVKQIIIKDNKI